MSADPARASSVVDWYERIAPVYDVCTKPLFQPLRAGPVRRLDLRAGLTVLDLACGTGQNFPWLVEGVGATGLVIGVDASAEMLARARAQCARRRWRNVHLVCGDARHVTREDLRRAVEPEELRIARVLCTHAAQLLPDWSLVFDRTFELLEPGGRYVVADGYWDERSWTDALFAALGGGPRWAFSGDGRSSRRFWEGLRRCAVDYHEERSTLLGMHLMIASGTRARSSRAAP